MIEFSKTLSYKVEKAVSMRKPPHTREISGLSFTAAVQTIGASWMVMVLGDDTLTSLEPILKPSTSRELQFARCHPPLKRRAKRVILQTQILARQVLG